MMPTLFQTLKHIYLPTYLPRRALCTSSLAKLDDGQATARLCFSHILDRTTYDGTQNIGEIGIRKLWDKNAGS